MPVSFVPINPKKFNIKAIENELKKDAKVAEKGMVKDWQSTYSTWSAASKPALTSKISVNLNGGVSIEIDLQGEVYLLVHEGTRPHIITARRAKRLAFQSGYRTKTQLGRIASRNGGAFGETVFRTSVSHPGFPGRKQGALIKRKWDPLFKRQMQRALSAGVKKTGHSI